MEHTVGLCHRVEQLVQAQYVGAHEAAPRIRQQRLLVSIDPSDRLSSSSTSRAPPASNYSPMCEPTCLAPPMNTSFLPEMAGILVLRMPVQPGTVLTRKG